MTEEPGSTWIAIGRVGRPHGRDGSFVVEQPSHEASHFVAGAELYVDQTPARVVASKRAGGKTVIKLDTDVRRGARLEQPRSALPELGAGEYYVFDLVGLDVETDDGRVAGTIADVIPGPANDVLELDTGALLPLVHACVLSVDLDARRVVVARSFVADG